MAKRQLSRRQQWRIQKIQQERLARARNKQKHLSEQINQLDHTQYHGIVVSHFGATLDIEDDASGSVVRCALRQNIDAIVCGDKIVWQKLANTPDNEQIQGVVTALEPRTSVLARPDFNGLMKPIAANIDQILIVTSPVPEFNEGLVDRYLVAAELSKIHPLLVLNKFDTLADDGKRQLQQRIKIYQDIGYKVIYTSAVSQHGLDTLCAQLEGKISVFVGQSGVGKSSLINALLPEADIRVGEVSQTTQKGTHTTSVSRLYHLRNESLKNASLIDSPGVREFGLWDISRDDVIHGFVELQSFTGHCRFRDCQHKNEPGCGLLKAVRENRISQQRLNSYHRIVESLDEAQ